MDADDYELLEAHIVKNPIFEGKHVKAISFRINILASLKKFVCDSAGDCEYENLKETVYSGSDLAAQNRKLEGAIHLSASAGSFESVLALAEANVDLNARTKDGKSALELANDEVCIELLKSIGADGWLPLMVAAERGLDQVENYLEYRSAVLSVLKKTVFSSKFQELVKNTIETQYFHWKWGPHESTSIKIDEDGCRISKIQSSPDFSCAIGNCVFETGLHVWAIHVERAQCTWLGVARGVTENTFSASPTDWSGDYLAAFCSDESEPIVAGGQRLLEMNEKFGFRSGQIVEFELDMNLHILKIKVDGILKCMVRNIDHRGVSPYTCMVRGEASTLQYTSVYHEMVSNKQISEPDRLIGFDNSQWTLEMDTILWELSNAGKCPFFVFEKIFC